MLRLLLTFTHTEVLGYFFFLGDWGKGD